MNSISPLTEDAYSRSTIASYRRPAAGPSATRYIDDLQSLSAQRHYRGSGFHDHSIAGWMSPINPFKSAYPRTSRRRCITMINHPIRTDIDHHLPPSIAFTNEMEPSIVAPPTEFTARRSSSFEYLLYASMALRSGEGFTTAVQAAPSQEPDNVTMGGDDRLRTFPPTDRFEDINTVTTTSVLKIKATEPSEQLSSEGRVPRKEKSCKCKKSRCLKLYCACFASHSLCSDACNCLGCSNMHWHNEDRHEATRIFKQHTGSRRERRERTRSSKSSTETSCQCKKSWCIKKYCPCFVLGAHRNKNCGCGNCRNYDE